MDLATALLQFGPALARLELLERKCDLLEDWLETIDDRIEALERAVAHDRT